MFQGYKCFYNGLFNQYQYQYQLHQLYHTSGQVKFGNNGFHMCKNLEDTLRYFDTFHTEIDICTVLGYGNYSFYEDEYNGYYDMFAFEYMFIEKILTRQEIIDYVLKLYPERVCRFISSFKLTEKEIIQFKNLYKDNLKILQTILYYQENQKDVYKNPRLILKKC